MAIITLTTDFGLKDFYVSSLKGAILKQLPNVTIVDISHDIEKFNLQDAAFIVKESYSSFPKNTVHIIGLFSELLTNLSYVTVKHNDHFFISADNGLFSLLFDEMPEKVISIALEKNQDLSFPVRDIFVKTACMLASGSSIDTLGEPKQELMQRIPFRASSFGNSIKGSIIYIDSYSNAISNIHSDLFTHFGKGKEFVIELTRNYSISTINNQYTDVPEGEIVALFNSSKLLEIAMRNAKASQMLNLKLNDSITINFQ